MLNGSNGKRKNTSTMDGLLTPTNSEQLLCSFFAKMGLPANTVNEPAFVELINNLNPSYDIPSTNSINNTMNRLSKYYDTVSNNQWPLPISITLDAKQIGDEYFLSYSIHYYKNQTIQKSDVFLQKMTITKIHAHETILRIQKHLNLKDVKFKNIVVRCAQLQKAFQNTGTVENSFICYFSYISRFAEEVIKLEYVNSAIEKMRHFICMIRSDDVKIKQLEMFFERYSREFVMPDYNRANWYQVLKMLENTTRMNDMFARCCEVYGWDFYVDGQTHLILYDLLTVLEYCKNSTQQLSYPNSTLSMVVPEIMYLKKFIEFGIQTPSFRNDISTIYTRHFTELLSSDRGRLYNLAVLLDPRFAYSLDIYSDEQWRNAEQVCKETIYQRDLGVSSSASTNNSFVDELLKQYRAHLSLLHFDKNILDPLYWWNNGIHRNALIQLLKRYALDMLSVPPCCIDGDFYFGKNGKYLNLNAVTSFQEFNDNLRVASETEIFRGRGRLSDNEIKQSYQEYTMGKMNIIENMRLNKIMIEEETQNETISDTIQPKEEMEENGEETEQQTDTIGISTEEVKVEEPNDHLIYLLDDIKQESDDN